jgi:hypothetical protein
MASMSSNTFMHTGLHYIDNAGALWVVGMYGNTVNAPVGVYSTDSGATWSETSALSGNGIDNITDEFVFNNQFWVTGTNSNNTMHFSWNPVTGGVSNVAGIAGAILGGTAQIGCSAFATHNGYMYQIAADGTGNGATQNITLWRYVAGTWQEIAQFPKGGGQNWGVWNPNTFKSALFDDVDGNMYAIYGFHGSPSKGFMCCKIVIDPNTLAPTLTDVTSTVIPGAIAFPNNPAGWANPRASVTIDQETNPGARQTLIYLSASDSSTTWTQFLWQNFFNVTLVDATNFNVGDTVVNGSASGIIMTKSGSVIGINPLYGSTFAASGSITDSTTSATTTFSGGAFTLGSLSQQDSGLDITIAPPRHAAEGAGARVFTSPGDFFVAEVGRARTATGVQFAVKVQGVTGSEIVSVYPYFDTKVSVPLRQMTIASVTGGSATLNVNNHQIDNVLADGSTVYTFIWQNLSDGITIGSKVRVAIRAA